uniref:KIB1-4 beta-propeller domain-containing protein n=1 Tax=Aegilops tauschii TaxID=37682 RepID=N1QTD4_AEGTA
MKEGDGWSSERRWPHGSTKFGGLSIIPEWNSLPTELVQVVADRVLSTTGGVDAYMDMRAVCSTWRSAIAKPSPLAAVAGLRFRPRHWVMLDLQPDDRNDDDDARLFLHVPTGRIRRLHLPVLRDNFVAGATDGLLVRGDMYPPHLARVSAHATGSCWTCNPTTATTTMTLASSSTSPPGASAACTSRCSATTSSPVLLTVSSCAGTCDMLHFPAALPRHFKHTSVKGGSHSTLVLLRWGSVVCAAPNSDFFTETEEAVETYLVSIVNYQGDVYCADARGCVFKLVAPAADQCDDDELLVIPEVSPPGVDVYAEEGDDDDDTKEGDDGSEMPSYLVESAGELLLVRYVDETLKVFRVDVEHKLLEEVKSLGGRTLFLGQERCVSVDAAKLPSVDGDCIYMLDFENVSMSDSEDMSMSDSEDMPILDSGDKCDMCVYNLRGDMVDIIYSKDFRARPFSLVQVLLWYCDVLPKL